MLIDFARLGNIYFMQVGSASAGHSSKSLHSNSQSKVCPEDSGIPGNMRHDYGNIYLPLIVIFIYTPIMVFYSVLITYISFMPYINFSNGFFLFFVHAFSASILHRLWVRQLIWNLLLARASYKFETGITI